MAKKNLDTELMQALINMAGYQRFSFNPLNWAKYFYWWGVATRAALKNHK